MVDQRTKGARGEYLVRDLLRDKTGYQFERVPASGALAYLKGDLFIPPSDSCKFCIEVKNYQDSAFNDKILTNKSNNFVLWWNKIQQQAPTNNKDPLLFFKYNRSAIFVATDIEPLILDNYIYIGKLNCWVMKAEEWLDNEEINWEK
jgi:hypothetical protein